MLDAMTHIKAQERLDFISDTRVGAGLLKRYDQQNHMNRLERQAYGTKQATVDDLTAAGIKVVKNG